MAVTESPTRTAAARPEIITHGVRPKHEGWTSWFTTTDHKKIGILYLWTVARLLRPRRRRGAAHPASSSGRPRTR